LLFIYFKTLVTKHLDDGIFFILNLMYKYQMDQSCGKSSITHSQGRPTTLLPPRSYGKREAAAAVDRLLKMGIKMPETC